jgi:hypothetical protein
MVVEVGGLSWWLKNRPACNPKTQAKWAIQTIDTEFRRLGEIFFTFENRAGQAVRPSGNIPGKSRKKAE